MKMNLKKMTLTNFKGQREKIVEFNNNGCEIKAPNGAGKTTLATAFYWLFCDKDYDLVSNPNIRPIDVDECTPRVEIEFIVDGKTVTVAKLQKRKVSDANGITKVALTNSYEVNAVPKSEKAFKEYLAELDIDTDKFLELSHPDVFISNMNDKKGKEHMKEILFSMGKELSDLEIAQIIGEKVIDTANLLTNYTLDEIDAMQGATLRKIKEDYGKDGEILNSKIEGLELAKVDIDTAELELEKNSIEKELAEVRANINSHQALADSYKSIADALLVKQMELSDLKRKVHEDSVKANTERNKAVNDARDNCNNIEYNIKNIENNMLNYENKIKQLTNELSEIKTQYTNAKAMEFDDSKCICPMCNQELPNERIDELKADFENKKKAQIENITNNGNNIKSQIDDLKAKNDKSKEMLAEQKKAFELAKEEFRQLSESVASDVVVEMITPEIKSLELEITEQEKQLEASKDIINNSTMLKSLENELVDKLTDIKSKISSISVNVEIDEKIMALRSKQSEYEQAKANAEKIKFQIDLIKRKKNELFTEEINKHFNLVSWQLFDYNKSGQYVEVCIPLIDGKQFGVSTNTGREMLAKLDIVKGLQKFFGQSIPVFLDGAESLSSETKSRIKVDNQLILLTVSE